MTLTSSQTSETPDLNAILQMGMEYHRNGQNGEAERCYLDILNQEPDHAEAMHLLGMLHYQKGDEDKALSLLDEVATRVPGSPVIHNNRGLVLMSIGNYREAIECFRKAIGIASHYAAAHNNLGVALRRMDLIREASQCYKRALEIQPNYPEVYYNLGKSWRSRRRWREAYKCYQQAVDQRPDYLQANQHLVWAQIKNEDIAGALATCDACLALNPGNFDLRYAQLRITDATIDNPDLMALKDIVEAGEVAVSRQTALYYWLGELSDQNENYEAAYEYFEKANNMLAATRSHDAAEFPDLISGLMEKFSDGPIPPSTNVSDWTPIFILGPSRSGKTLTESIIADASEAHSVGESDDWLLAVEDIKAKHGIDGSLPNVMAQLFQDHAQEVGAAFIEFAQECAPPSRYSIYTSPINAHYVPLILMALPQAKILYCQRNPMDNCAQILFGDYLDGNAYAFRQDGTASYYASYCELMEFWMSRYGDRIHSLSYEDMVRNSVNTADEIRNFCGLPGDSKVAPTEFHSDEIGRWRNYETKLQPMYERLQNLLAIDLSAAP